MVFRVLIAGTRRPSCSYAALDTLLANRMPDVELITAGGRGVPMLAATLGRPSRSCIVQTVA